MTEADQHPERPTEGLPAFHSSDEHAALAQLAERLERDRPVPRPGFRSELRRELMDAGTDTKAPSRLRVAIGAYAFCGLMLFAIAGLGVAGAGPLAA